tara:strand:- start:8814 stop:10262 length:1449 start_codon:yes stop_codon:yes gene_type:complete
MKVLWLYLVFFLCCSLSLSKAQLLEEGSTTTIEIESQGGVEEVTETTVTIEHQDTGDVLDGDNGIVSSKYEGDADIDWGGAGSIYSHTSCSDSASGFPATSTDGRTSACGHARSNSLTTWRQYIQLNSFGIEEGGEVNYEFLFAFPNSMYQNSGQTAYVQTKGYNDNVLQWDSGQIVIDKTTFTQNPYNYNNNTNWVNTVTGSYDFANALDKVYLEIGGYGEYYWDEFQYNVVYNQITTVIETYLQVVQQEELLNTTIDMLDDYEVVEVFTPEAAIPEINLDFDTPIENDMSFDEPIVMEEIETFDTITEEIANEIEIIEIEPEIENLSPVNEDTEQVEEVEIAEVSTEPEATDEAPSPANEEVEENTTKEEVKEVAEEKPEPVKVQTTKKIAEKKQERAKKILNNFTSTYDNVAQMTTLALVNALGPEIKTYEQIQIQNVSPSWYQAEEIYSDVIMHDPLGNYFGVRDSLTFNNMVDMQYE